MCRLSPSFAIGVERQFTRVGSGSSNGGACVGGLLGLAEGVAVVGLSVGVVVVGGSLGLAEG